MSTMKSIAAAIKRGGEAWPEPKPEPKPEPVIAPHSSYRGRKPKPPRPVDFLAPLFPGRPESLLTIGKEPDEPDSVAAVQPWIDFDRVPSQPRPGHFVKRARPGPRGGAGIVKYLAGRGIELRPTIDGSFYVVTAGGRLDEDTRRAITAAGRLLTAYLHGTPLRCALPNHVGGEPPEAVTVTLGGAGWCGECS